MTLGGISGIHYLSQLSIISHRGCWCREMKTIPFRFLETPGLEFSLLAPDIKPLDIFSCESRQQSLSIQKSVISAKPPALAFFQVIVHATITSGDKSPSLTCHLLTSLMSYVKLRCQDAAGQNVALGPLHHAFAFHFHLHLVDLKAMILQCYAISLMVKHTHTHRMVKRSEWKNLQSNLFQYVSITFVAYTKWKIVVRHWAKVAPESPILLEFPYHPTNPWYHFHWMRTEIPVLHTICSIGVEDQARTHPDLIPKCTKRRRPKIWSNPISITFCYHCSAMCQAICFVFVDLFGTITVAFFPVSNHHFARFGNFCSNCWAFWIPINCLLVHSMISPRLKLASAKTPRPCNWDLRLKRTAKGVREPPGKSSKTGPMQCNFSWKSCCLPLSLFLSQKKTICFFCSSVAMDHNIWLWLAVVVGYRAIPQKLQVVHPK